MTGFEGISGHKGTTLFVRDILHGDSIEEIEMRTGRKFVVVAAGMLLAVGTNRLWGESIHIPNASFESPETAFVDVNIGFWQKGLTPVWYDESSGYTWSQLTGVFLNVPPRRPEAHIDNCDGNQAVWLFAVPEVECRVIVEYLSEIDRVVGLGNIPGEILVYTTPPRDPTEVDQVFAAGADRVACSLEVWDEELAKIITPGKAKFTGRQRHVDCLTCIANTYGSNRACMSFVVGVEGTDRSDEDGA